MVYSHAGPSWSCRWLIRAIYPGPSFPCPLATFGSHEKVSHLPLPLSPLYFACTVPGESIDGFDRPKKTWKC